MGRILRTQRRGQSATLRQWIELKTRSILSNSSKATVMGGRPEGVSDPASAARAVREMFTSIAPRYDLLNHVLSFNVDRLWWRKTARSFSSILKQPDARVLDLSCATGDMTFAFRREGAQA